MSTREHSIATWCKRFQIDLWNLHDRMKAGELILYEKRGEDEVNVTHSAMNKIKELISGIERACWTSSHAWTSLQRGCFFWIALMSAISTKRTCPNATAMSEVALATETQKGRLV